MATLQRRLAFPALKIAFDTYLQQNSNTNGVSIRQALETLIFDSSGNYTAFVTDMDLINGNGAPRNNAALPANCRIIVLASDGAVLYDSSKSTNTKLNIGVTSTSDGKPVIGDNHMTRIEIMHSALSPSGVGTSTRLSNTTRRMSQYICYRVGQTLEEPKGFIRFSIEDIGSSSA
jgi:hypothetical protein